MPDCTDDETDRERIAVAIENTDTPRDVFLAGDEAVSAWIKAKRTFAALARALAGEQEAT